jgi:hypothetical protein
VVYGYYVSSRWMLSPLLRRVQGTLEITMLVGRLPGFGGGYGSLLSVVLTLDIVMR